MATSTSTSQLYAQNFWSPDDSTSTEVLITHFNQGIKTVESLLQFYKERISIEDDYARKLGNLTKRFPLTSYELQGTTLRESLSMLNTETKQLSLTHASEASTLQDQVYKPLDEFLSDLKAQNKSTETEILKLLKLKKTLEAKVEQAQKKYEMYFSKLSSYKTEQILLDETEAHRTQLKIQKTQSAMLEARRVYFELVKQQHQVHDRWQNEWFQTCETYQSYDESKIKFLKTNVWGYANSVSSACLADDQSSENVRLSLEGCSYKKDIPIFVESAGTGSKTKAPLEFVDYAKGQRQSKEEQYQQVAVKNIPVVKQQLERQQSELNRKKNPPPKMTEQEKTKFEMLDRREETFKELQEQAQQEAQNMKIQKENDSSTRRKAQASAASFKVMSEYSNPTSATSYQSGAGAKDPLSSSAYSNPLSSSYGSNGSTGTTGSSRPTVGLYKKRSKNLETNDILKNSHNPLEAYLQDLSLGGNGNMSKFRDSMISINSIKDNDDTNNIKRRSAPNLLDQKPSIGNARVERRKSLGGLLKENQLFDSHTTKPSSSKNSKHQSYQPNLQPQQQSGQGKLRRSKSQTQITSNNKLDKSNLPSHSSEGYPVLKYCKAQYNYNADIEQELGFKKKDVLMVLHQQPDGWWFCENVCTSESGLAPSNYLIEL